MTTVPGPVVSTEWLAANLGAPDVRVFDSTWFLARERSARGEWASAHIPGARFFDIGEISNKKSKLPHMLPNMAVFSMHAGKLGIRTNDAVVAYDTMGLFSAARAWWMFRAMGHDNVAVLDGGLPKWRAEGRPVDSTTTTPKMSRYMAKPRPALVRGISHIKANLASHAEQMVDARARARFKGEEGEPRPGMRAGHIPGARNVPYTELLNPDGTFKPDEDLKRIFAAEGVDLNKPVIASCGSGITANIVLLAMAKLGHPDNALYDGSWSEYSMSLLPAET